MSLTRFPFAILPTVVLLAACGRRTPPRSVETPTGRGTGEPTSADSTPLNYIEQVTGNTATDIARPLVVTLHGRGSRPSSFAHFFDDFERPARFLHLEAPIDEGNGRAWWSFRGKTREQIREIVRELARRVMRTIELKRTTTPTFGDPIVVGFSQGAMVAYDLALEHGQAFRDVYAISGVLFRSLVPTELPRNLPKLHVFHGDADPVIAVRSGISSVEPLRQAGVELDVQTFANVPHWIAGPMKTELHRSLGERLPRTR